MDGRDSDRAASSGRDPRFTAGPYASRPAYLTQTDAIKFWRSPIWTLDAKAIIGYAYGSSREESEANARLLAASWEMWEALKCVTVDRMEPGRREFLLEHVQHAIAKAEGREPGSDSAPREASELGRPKPRG